MEETKKYNALLSFIGFEEVAVEIPALHEHEVEGAVEYDAMRISQIFGIASRNPHLRIDVGVLDWHEREVESNSRIIGSLIRDGKKFRALLEKRVAVFQAEKGALFL